MRPPGPFARRLRLAPGEGPGTEPRWGLPGPCEICRSWSADAICDDCLHTWLPAVTRCPRCAIALGKGSGSGSGFASGNERGGDDWPRAAARLSSCGACTSDPPPFVRAVAACDYAYPWDQMVRDFKFAQRPELAGPMARLMARALQPDGQALGRAVHGSATHPVDAVLPVPLSPARLAERGYNQAWELARRLASTANLPAHPDWLLRPRDSAHQADLDRSARAANLTDAFVFHPHRRPAVRGLRLALVDDVLTTGATVRHAAAELLRAGAAEVQVWVFARTP